MRLAISGTYSSGKTTTSIALAHMTGVARTFARTMREIMPEAYPGRRLEELRAPELVQLLARRYAERAVHESHLPDGFISDGSSLHEWAYGMVRTVVVINPNETVELASVERTPEMGFLEEVLIHLGTMVKQHAKKSYDAFAHLPVEFPLVPDGHRPVSERFRRLSDELLVTTLDELRIPYELIGGTIAERLERIVTVFGLPEVLTAQEAIDRAAAEMSLMDVSSEADRGVQTGGDPLLPA